MAIVSNELRRGSGTERSTQILPFTLHPVRGHCTI